MKALITVTCSLVVAAFFLSNPTATGRFTAQLALFSSLAVVAFAAPSYIAIVKSRGWKRGATILAGLGCYALAIESLALASGIPYGGFTYTGHLASKVLNLTPWTVAFAYPPIILLAYAVASRLNTSKAWWRTIALTALLATSCDLVLDPAAVRLGFWYWHNPGFYYGVPLVNFVGWLLTSSLAGLLLHWLWQRQHPSASISPALPAAIGYSGLATVWFWTAANAWLGQFIPAIIGIFLTIFCWRILASKQVQ